MRDGRHRRPGLTGLVAGALLLAAAGVGAVRGAAQPEPDAGALPAALLTSPPTPTAPASTQRPGDAPGHNGDAVGRAARSGRDPRSGTRPLVQARPPCGCPAIDVDAPVVRTGVDRSEVLGGAREPAGGGLVVRRRRARRPLRHHPHGRACRLRPGGAGQPGRPQPYAGWRDRHRARRRWAARPPTAWSPGAPTPRRACGGPTCSARTSPARLLLVTCGGEFDRRTGHYERNVVVFAVPA